MSKKSTILSLKISLYLKQTLKIKRPYDVCEHVFVCARVLCVDLCVSATVHGSDELHS